jgi:hypothetical protein
VVAAVLSVAVVLGACGARAASSDPVDSGIRGLVLLGPTCPAQHLGGSCLQRYRATIAIRNDATGSVVAQVRSSVRGRFRIALAPGTYLLVPQQGQPFPTSPRQTVTVHPDRYTRVIVRYDTGIR